MGLMALAGVHAAIRVGCMRPPATAVPDEWPPGGGVAARQDRQTEPGLQVNWPFHRRGALGDNGAPNGAYRLKRPTMPPNTDEMLG